MKREFFRFAVAGGSCFIIELAVLYSLTEFAGINYLTSAFWAFIVSVIVNYIMCAYWVFAAKKRSLAKTIVFAATSVAGLGINQLCMWTFVEFVGLHYMLAKVVAACIVTIWNFITKRMVLTH